MASDCESYALVALALEEVCRGTGLARLDAGILGSVEARTECTATDQSASNPSHH